MKRSEVTTEILRNMGWNPTDRNDLRLKDIVFNLQENDYWKFLRCRVDDSKVYEEKEFGMCSTYMVKYHREYFEVSADKKNWHSVMYRDIEFNRYCIYAD